MVETDFFHTLPAPECDQTQPTQTAIGERAAIRDHIAYRKAATEKVSIRKVLTVRTYAQRQDAEYYKRKQPRTILTGTLLIFANKESKSRQGRPYGRQSIWINKSKSCKDGLTGLSLQHIGSIFYHKVVPTALYLTSLLASLVGTSNDAKSLSGLKSMMPAFSALVPFSKEGILDVAPLYINFLLQDHRHEESSHRHRRLNICCLSTLGPGRLSW